MLRISDLDWQKILFNRSAAWFLAVCAAVSPITLALVHFDINLDVLGWFSRGVLSLAGEAGAVGFISLLICMSLFWLKCDSSRTGWRAFWFLVLILGFAYGSSILYYAFVYLPGLAKWLRKPDAYRVVEVSIQPNNPCGRIGPFRRSLLVGWACLVLPLAAAVTLRKIPASLLAVVAAAFLGWLAAVVLEGAVSTIVFAFRSGRIRQIDPAQQIRSGRESGRWNACGSFERAGSKNISD